VGSGPGADDEPDTVEPEEAPEWVPSAGSASPALTMDVPDRDSGALLTSPAVVDAVVIGSGPNGLVAANALADAGWDVLLLEAQDTVGGAVRSAEVIAPGFSTDLYSAFYPLAAASPVIKDLDLAGHGLRWVQAPQVLAHVLQDGRAAVLSTDLATTSASLDQFAAGDGQAWADMFAQWRHIRDPLLDALFTPFPPVKAAVRLLRRTYAVPRILPGSRSCRSTG
jgi:phytoene dehydrogenase-like protein